MKKLLFIALITVIGISSINAQSNKRSSALNYLKYEELDRAQETIEEVILHPKTAEDPRSWWYRGQIYQAIYTSKDFKNLSKDAITIAFDSYKKALLYNFIDPSLHKLDIENSKLDQIKFQKALMDINTKYVESEIIMDIIRNRFPYLGNILVNKGVDQFQKDKDYPAAVQSFERSLFVSGMSGRVDTAVIYYTALSAQKAKDYKTSNYYFDETIKVGYGTNDRMRAEMFILKASNYKEMGDTVKYVKTIDKGIEKYPNEFVLVSEKIDYLINNGKSDEALGLLELAAEKEPDNKILFFNLGIIYEKAGDKVKAEEAYKRAVEIDPNYVSGNYSLGLVYYNQGADAFEASNDIPPTKPKEYDAKINEGKEHFKQALPFFEKAYENDSEDLNTLLALKEIYYKLEMMDKYEPINAKIKEKTK
jgi:tetratricopeptide (TPR) repeat protein